LLAPKVAAYPIEYKANYIGEKVSECVVKPPRLILSFGLKFYFSLLSSILSSVFDEMVQAVIAPLESVLAIFHVSFAGGELLDDLIGVKWTCPNVGSRIGEHHDVRVGVVARRQMINEQIASLSVESTVGAHNLWLILQSLSQFSEIVCCFLAFHAS